LAYFAGGKELFELERFSIFLRVLIYAGDFYLRGDIEGTIRDMEVANDEDKPRGHGSNGTCPVGP
jgi:hypothetical protein